MRQANPLLVPLLLALTVNGQAQSIVTPDQTVRTVVALDAADGDLQAAGFMNLDEGVLPTNRPYQVKAVAGELWITDDVLSRILRWDATGSVQLGSIDLAPNRLRGIEFAFGSVWVAGGTPSGAVTDFLFELSPSGTLLNSYPMPGLINGVSTLGSQLLLAHNDEDQLLLVDPGTGLVSGIFHDSDGVSGIDLPDQVVGQPNGNVLAAGLLPPFGVYEYDGAGNQILYVDTTGLGTSGCRGVWPLDNGDIAFTAGTGVYVYERASGLITKQVETVTAYYLSELPDVLLGNNECGPSVPNSTGLSAQIAATGSDTSATTHFRLTAQNLPPVQFGYFLTSQTSGFVSGPGGSQGDLCLGGAIGRFNATDEIRFSSNDTFFSLTVDTTDVPSPSGSTAILSGETWRFQCWYRDVNPAATSNFTDAVAVTFQ